MARDAGLREFVAEQRAIDAARPASTRQAGIDHSTSAGAVALAQRIKSFWGAAGFLVETQVMRGGGTADAPVWTVRSNLVAGLPPAAMGGGNGNAE